MPSSLLLRNLGSVTLLVGVIVAVVRAGRRTQLGVHLVARDAVSLSEVCRAANRLLQSWPPPRAVTIDVTEIAALDYPSVERLRQACRRWSDAGVRVTIEGCNGRVAAALARGELEAEVCCSERASGVGSASPFARP